MKEVKVNSPKYYDFLQLKEGRKIKWKLDDGEFAMGKIISSTFHTGNSRVNTFRESAYMLVEVGVSFISPNAKFSGYNVGSTFIWTFYNPDYKYTRQHFGEIPRDTGYYEKHNKDLMDKITIL